MRTPLRYALVVSSAFFLLGVAATPDREPCNPYYPLPPKGQWTYREGLLDGGPRLQKTVSVRSHTVENQRHIATVEQSVIGPGSIATGGARMQVVCDRGRIGTTIEGVAQGREGNTTSRGRVSAQLPGLPPADQLVTGYQWVSHSRIETTEDGRSALTTGVRKNRVAGTESVTVPAGTFPRALKILSQETLRQGKEGRVARQELVEWYVRDLGLVKRETRILSEKSSITSIEALISSSLLQAR